MLLHNMYSYVACMCHYTRMLWLKKWCAQRRGDCRIFVAVTGLLPVSIGYQPYRQAIGWFLDTFFVHTSCLRTPAFVKEVVLEFFRGHFL